MFIYSPAKSRRSGTAMQKMPLRGSMQRALKAREVLSGYPRQEPFETREEIEQYLCGDEIQCLLCGRPFKNLGIHLKRIHQTDANDYRIKYNMPQYYGLVGRATSERMTENSNEPGRVAFIREIGKSMGGRPHAVGRKCALVLNETSKRMKENGYARDVGGIRKPAAEITMPKGGQDFNVDH